MKTKNNSHRVYLLIEKKNIKKLILDDREKNRNRKKMGGGERSIVCSFFSRWIVWNLRNFFLPDPFDE